MKELKEKAIKAKELERQYRELRSMGELEESFKVEGEYLKLRKEVVDEVTITVEKKKGIPLYIIKQKIANTPLPKRRETGIDILDKNMIDQKGFTHGNIGGISLGNFIQVAGSRGSGKTSMIMKIISGLSNFESVVWFDFEMGERRFTEVVNEFPHNDRNFIYYNGDRKLTSIINEIKLQYASGINNFVIDSTMKIISGWDRYEQFSSISRALSELTSTLEINIWMINQMAQSSEANGVLALKHGNDAEYDADIIFFIVSIATDEDENGIEQIDETKRILYCTKNRQDHRLFKIEIRKSDIFQTSRDYDVSHEDGCEVHTYKG